MDNYQRIIIAQADPIQASRGIADDIARSDFPALMLSLFVIAGLTGVVITLWRKGERNAGELSKLLGEQATITVKAIETLNKITSSNEAMKESIQALETELKLSGRHIDTVIEMIKKKD